MSWLRSSGSKVDPPLLAREFPLLELAQSAITDLAKKLVMVSYSMSVHTTAASCSSDPSHSS